MDVIPTTTINQTTTFNIALFIVGILCIVLSFVLFLDWMIRERNYKKCIQYFKNLKHKRNSTVAIAANSTLAQINFLGNNDTQDINPGQRTSGGSKGRG